MQISPVPKNRSALSGFPMKRSIMLPAIPETAPAANDTLTQYITSTSDHISMYTEKKIHAAASRSDAQIGEPSAKSAISHALSVLDGLAFSFSKC